MWTENFQISKLDLEKAEEWDQIASIQRIIEKAKEFQKNIYFCLIDYAKAFDCVDHNKLWKILKEMKGCCNKLWITLGFVACGVRGIWCGDNDKACRSERFG